MLKVLLVCINDGEMASQRDMGRKVMVLSDGEVLWKVTSPISSRHVSAFQSEYTETANSS